jgi:hypothetical protein
MISDAEKLALLRASKDLTPLELIEAICEACKATFINSDIARKEREACAKIFDDANGTGRIASNRQAAEAIKARGQ